MVTSAEAFNSILHDCLLYAKEFMNNNQVPATDVALNETRLENGKESNGSSDDGGSLSRRFGMMDLWSIRRNARKFKIHNRIPRL